jgi:hypothetical protein
MTQKGKYLHGLDHEEVAGINLGVLVGIEVLLGDHNAITEQSLVDGLTLLLGDEHACFFCKETLANNMLEIFV